MNYNFILNIMLKLNKNEFSETILLVIEAKLA